MEDRQRFLLLPKLLNGAIGGVLGEIIVFPLDLIKTRLQTQQSGPNGEKMYKNIMDCFRKTIRSEGYLAIYRGLAVTICFVTPEKAIQLSANDYFRYHLTTEDGKLPLNRQLEAGGLAGFTKVIISTPMDLLKIQMQDAGRIATHAKLINVPKINARKIAIQILKEKGISGLYRGFLLTMLRDVSFSMFYFPLFESLTKFEPRKTNDSDKPIIWNILLSGFVAAGIAAWIITPFDVIKTRLQSINTAKGEREFTGTIDCCIKTLRYEGVTAFFKGGLCRAIVSAPHYGITQFVYFLNIGEWLLLSIK